MNAAPDLLDYLLHLPKLENVHLVLDVWDLYYMNHKRLRALIQSSVGVSLTIDGSSPFPVKTRRHTVAECLTNLLHLQGGQTTDSGQSPTSQKQLEPAARTDDDTVRHDDNGSVEERRVPNKHCWLRHLSLTGINLDDRYFIRIIVEALSTLHLQVLDVSRNDMQCQGILALAEQLPTSQLEVLDVSGNQIGCQGILALAMQLPRTYSLKIIQLHWNPWWESGDEKCWAAIVQGMGQNRSIERVNTKDNDGSPITVGTVPPLVRHYCYSNWARRRILASSSIVPQGLWPMILERAGNDSDYLYDKMSDREVNPTSIYFLLQSTPMLSILCLPM